MKFGFGQRVRITKIMRIEEYVEGSEGEIVRVMEGSSFPYTVQFDYPVARFSETELEAMPPAEATELDGLKIGDTVQVIRRDPSYSYLYRKFGKIDAIDPQAEYPFRVDFLGNHFYFPRDELQKLERKVVLPEPELKIGDRVKVVRERVFLGAFHGQVGELLRIEPSYHRPYLLRVERDDVWFNLDDLERVS